MALKDILTPSDVQEKEALRPVVEEAVKLRQRMNDLVYKDGYDKNDKPVLDVKVQYEKQFGLWKNILKKTDPAKEERYKRQFERQVNRFYRVEDPQTAGDEWYFEEDISDAETGPSAKRHISDLETEINNYFSEKSQVYLAIQNMWLRTPPVAPSDLVVGDRRAAAIEAAFALEPEIADMLKQQIKLPEDNPDRIAAEGFLKTTADILKATYETTREAKEGLESLESQTVEGAVVGKFKNMGEFLLDHPAQSLAAVGIIVAGLTLIYRRGGEYGKKFVSGLGLLGGIGLLAGGSAWAADTVWKGWDDNNRGLFDRLRKSPSTFVESDAYKNFRGLFAEMVPDNEEALRDVLRLGETKTSAVYDVFAEAYANNKKEIDPAFFRARHEVSSDVAARLNGKTTYIAIESVMLECAKRAKEKGFVPAETAGKLDDVKLGLAYFNETYVKGGDFELMYVAMDLTDSHGMERTGDEAKEAGFAAGLIREDVNANKSEVQKAAEIQNLYKEVNKLKDVQVEARGGGIMAVQGYIYRYSFDASANEHKFTDFYDSKNVRRIPAGTKSITDLEGLVKYSEQRMTEKYQELGGTGDLKWNREGGYWEMATPDQIQAFNGVGNAQEDVPVIFYAHEGYDKPVFKLQGNKAIFNTISEVTGQFEYEVIGKRMRDAMPYVLGQLQFKIEKAENTAPDTTEFTITYGANNANKGTIVYKARAIESVTLQPCDELDTAQRNAAATLGLAYMKTLDSEKFLPMRDIRIAFEDHWHAGSFADGVARGLSRTWEAVERSMSDEEFLLWGRETYWNEVIDAKRDEYIYNMQERIHREIWLDRATGKVNPNPNISRIQTDIANELSKLSTYATEINNTLRGNADDGELFEDTLMDYSKQIEVLGYKNKEYVNFHEDLKRLLITGFDWKGADGMATARHIRGIVMMTAYEYAYPIPEGTQPKEKDYLVYLLGQVEWALKYAQKNPKSNTNLLGYELDRRVGAGEFKAALVAAKTQTYEEFAGAPGTVPGIGATPAAAPTAGPSSGASMKSAEILEEKQDAVGELEDVYNIVDKLELSVLTDPFDEYLALRREKIINSFNYEVDGLGTGITRKQFDGVKERYEGIANREVARYLGLRTHGTNRLPVLRQGMEMMTESMVPLPDWADPSKIVLDYLSGHYKFENNYFQQKPEVFTDIMRLYLEKIDNSSSQPTPQPVIHVRPATAGGNPGYPEAYANYFLDELSKLLPDSRLGSLEEPYRNIDEDTWNNLYLAAKQIDSYEDWWLKGAQSRPTIPEMDLTKMKAKNFERSKRTAQENFMEWFDKDIDLADTFRIDGEWPVIFRDSVDKRLNEIILISSGPQDLKDKLDKFSQFVRVEKYLYKHLIEGDFVATKGEWTNMDEVHTKVESYFRSNWPTNLPGFIGAINSEIADFERSITPLRLLYQRPVNILL